MKKVLCLMMSVALLALTVSGCGGAPAPEPAPAEAAAASEAAAPEEAAPAPEEAEPEEAAPEGPTGELNLAIFEGGFGPDFWNEAIKAFEADNPGVTVNMQISPTIGDMIRPQIVAGNVPDFMNLNDNDQTGIVLSLIAENGLTDLTDVFDGPQYDSDTPLRDKLIPGFLESIKCAPYGDGKVYIAPGEASPMGLIYNKTLFTENGWELPVTWEDFFALGEEAKAAGTSLFTYQGIYPGYVESMLWPAIASAIGTEDFAKITSYQPGIWTDPRVIEVLKQFENIYTTGNLMAGSVALNHTQSQTDQMQNKALFIPNGIWMENEMIEVPAAEGYSFGLTPSPVMAAGDTRYVMSSVGQYSIPKNAKNPELAKLFLRFLYTDEIIALQAELGGGAVMCTTNGMDLAQPYITEGVYGMFGIYNEPNVASLVVGIQALPENSKINYSDEVFLPLSDVMSGNLTAEDWAANIDQACQDIQDGK